MNILSLFNVLKLYKLTLVAIISLLSMSCDVQACDNTSLMNTLKNGDIYEINDTFTNLKKKRGADVSAALTCLEKINADVLKYTPIEMANSVKIFMASIRLDSGKTANIPLNSTSLNDLRISTNDETTALKFPSFSCARPIKN